ncbi:MAG: hypothetical protein ACKVT0_14045 [Planctomycetaceae bacterium]
MTETTTTTDAEQGKAAADPPVKTADEGDEPSSTGDSDIDLANAENMSETDGDETADDSSTENSKDDPFVPPSPDGDKKKKPKVVLEKRPALTGRWHAVLSQQGSDFYVWLLDFSVTDDAAQPDGKKREVTVVASLEENADLKSFAVTDTTANLVFSIEDAELDFVGELTDGIVYGNVVLNGKTCGAMRLLPTKDKDLKPHETPDEAEGIAELQKAIGSPKPFDALREFCRKHPEYPLTLEIYKQLQMQAATEKLDEAAIKALFSDMVENSRRWGPRMELWTKIEGATLMAFTSSAPQYALEIFDEVGLSIPEDLSAWKPRLEAGRTKAHIEIGLAELGSSDELIQQAAYQKLQDIHVKNPFDPSLTYSMANYAATSGKADDAIALYAELVALPMMERLVPVDAEKSQLPPSEALAKLWNKKHGNTDGLEAHLNEIYEKRIRSFVDQPIDEASSQAGNRVALCELFTGAECPPCVAADVATGAVELRYPRSDLVVIRYHQHIPGPDPLTNEDSEARFSYYRPRGTPAVFLNGEVVENVGGFFPQTIGGYESLQQGIDGVLPLNSDVQIEIQASGTGPEYNISVKLTGITAEHKDLRLRIVLAEEKIEFLAGNGIRSHEMVVRSMPGGARGEELSADKLEVQQKVNLDELKTNLGNYLKAYEEGQDVEFSAKPLDLNRLHVVAFVQNEETHEILQTAIIPLSATTTAATESETSGGN